MTSDLENSSHMPGGLAEMAGKLDSVGNIDPNTYAWPLYDTVVSGQWNISHGGSEFQKVYPKKDRHCELLLI